MSYYRDQLESWLKEIDVCAPRVFDIGGGAKPIFTRVRSWEVEDYRIFDNEAEEPKIENPKGIRIAYKKMDICESMDDIFDHDNQADIAFCLEVMEYIWDPVAALHTIAGMIKQHGHLYISFPFVYPIHNPPGIDYMRYTEEGARKILEMTGFEVLEVRPRLARNPQALRAFYASDGMHPRRDGTVDHTGYLVTCKKK